MNTLLSNVDRVISKFSPLNQMLETVAEHILPTTTAKAGYSCSGYCGTYCLNGGLIWRQYYVDCLGSQCRTGCGCDKYTGSHC